MVGVAQQVEHRVVIPGVAGSSPVAHPTERKPRLIWTDQPGLSAVLAHDSPVTLTPMQVFANIVSYGLALGAAACLSTALARLATRAAKSPSKHS